MANSRLYFFPLTILSAIIISGCASGPGALQQNRKFFSTYKNFPPAKARQDYLRNLKERYPVSNDEHTLQRIKNIVVRLNKYALGNSANEWNVTILKDKRQFACIPAPHEIVIFTGIFQHTAGNSQMSALIAHLMAHQQALHGNDRYRKVVTAAEAESKMTKSELQRMAVAAYTGTYPASDDVLPFSEAHEKLADRLSVLYMTRAGYSPDAALKFWSSFEEAQGDKSTPLFVKIHPIDKNRIANLKKIIKRTKEAAAKR